MILRRFECPHHYAGQSYGRRADHEVVRMITAEVPDLSSSPCRRPSVLRPYIPEEAVSGRMAAKYANVTPQTIASWAEKHNIGRVILRKLVISRVALQALLEDEQELLSAYLSGDRESPSVRRMYARLGIDIPLAERIGSDS